MLDDYLRHLAKTGIVDPYEALSEREREVFQLIAEGRSNKEMADLLYISVTTVETHRAHILQKLDVHNAAELVPAAEAAGMIHDIDRWVLERALDVLQQRRAQGRPVRLFVPQSPRTLARDAYADWLSSAIAVRGLEGPSLVIDIRLADALIHSVTLRQFCEAMVPVGVQFCLSQYEHSPDADSLLTQLPFASARR
jgi:DNA-binding CsgD family transcriptional regulator